MIIIKEGTLERTENWQDSDIHILTDFDRTITDGDSIGSWNILSKSDLVPKEYVTESKKLYDYYSPLEIDENIDFETKNKLMSEWWSKHINLFIKYKLSEEAIDLATQDSNFMTFRKGAKQFLENMKKRNIPVVIISAGIGNFIEKFLIKQDCYFDNIYIVSNFLKFENGISIGIQGNLMHSLNKNEVFLLDEIKNIIAKRCNVILLGDIIADIMMVKNDEREKALKIGFLEEKVEENKKHFENNFDVVCTDNTGYDELTSYLPVLDK